MWTQVDQWRGVRQLIMGQSHVQRELIRGGQILVRINVNTRTARPGEAAADAHVQIAQAQSSESGPIDTAML